MKRAREILQEYEKGRRDFQGVSLRGLSFKGEDLSGADFSRADIRGTNFQRAILTGAKFCGAEAGLQKRWVVVLLAGVFVLAVISAFMTLISLAFLWLTYNSDNPEQENAGWVALALLVIFWITIIRNGVGKAAAIGAVAFGFTVAGEGAIAFVLAVVGAGIGTFAFTVAGAIIFPGAAAIAGAITFAGAVVAAEFLGKPFVVTFALSGPQILLSAYTAYRAIKGDEKYALILSIGNIYAAIGGTSFRDADLTDTDFTHATLKSTDFRGANITRTCWKSTIKLDLIRPGEKYLKDAKIRELVRTGQGENQDFNRFNDLQGVNLKGANLTNASFIEANLNLANLQDADLSRAKLVGTFLDQADLTGATLTGAFLEDWGITTRTKLDGIKCDYVYMRLPPEKRPEFLKLTPQESLNDNPRRQPADWEKNFEEDEFVDFITPMVETLDLYHNQAVDPRIVAYSFRKLQEDHPEAELRMRSMEVRGKNDEGLLIKAETTPQADHSVLHSEYFNTYDRLKALPPEQLRLLLVDKEKYTKRLEALLDTAVNRPSGVNINIENYSNQGVTNMSESTGDQIHIRENSGAVGNKGENSGAVVNQGENSGAVVNQGEIKGSKIAHTINEAQPKTLAETAAEIQQLLKQLEQSNSTETTAGQMTVAAQAIEIVENNPTLKQRVIGVLKSAGTEAFKEALDNPVANILVAAFQGWTEP